MSSPLASPLPWDLVSAAYSAEIVPMFEHYARDAIRLAAAPPGARIVDVACGPGTLAFIAADAGHPVDAIDFSPEMLSYLETRRLAAHDTRITAREGDGQALPYADATFGAAFSMFGLMFFPDRAAGFRELRRVLVPGARAVVASWTDFAENPIYKALFTTLGETLAKILPPGAAPPPSPPPLMTEDACRAEMSAAFADVEVHRITHAHQLANVDELWAYLQRTMAPMVLMKRNLGDAFTVVSDAVAAALRGVVGDGPVALEMPAWLSVGVAR